MIVVGNCGELMKQLITIHNSMSQEQDSDMTRTWSNESNDIDYNK